MTASAQTGAAITRTAADAVMLDPQAASPPDIAFVYETLPSRIVFGVGAVARLREEIERGGARRVLAVTDGPAGQRVVAPLTDLVCHTISEVRVHVPVDDVDSAEAACAAHDTDLTVCVGGGSAIGLGKALAHRRGQPLVAVPTTYSGSEMTPIYGITSGEHKQTGRDPAVLPRGVIYDPALTTSLPASVTSTSGMNALAHCAEALYSPDGSPIVALMAAHGLSELVGGLPAAIDDPNDLSARSRCLLGSYLAGAALGSSSMGLHHRLCHVLGGMSRAGHGDLNAVALPHILAFNAPAAPAAMRMIAQAIAVEDPAAGLFDFARRIGAPRSLADIGVPVDSLDAAAAAIADQPGNNPRTYTVEQIRELLRVMYEGHPPASAVS